LEVAGSSRGYLLAVEVVRTTAYYRDGTKYVVEFTCLLEPVDPGGAAKK
jgi:hypothetical protein